MAVNLAGALSLTEQLLPVMAEGACSLPGICSRRPPPLPLTPAASRRETIICPLEDRIKSYASL